MLPSLKVKIGADTSGLDKGLKSSSASIKKFANVAAMAAKIVAAAFAATVGALAVLAIKQAKIIDQTAKLARRLGVTTKGLQAMSLVADEAGVSQGALASSLGLMQRNLVEAAGGTGLAVDALDRLGLSAENLMGLKPDEQFERIADRLKDIEDPAIKTATAMDIFGRSGGQVLNMLDGYNEKILDATEYQNKFGISVSEIDAQKIELANDAWARVKGALSGVGNMIATYVAPLITKMSNKLLDSSFDAQLFGRIGKSVMAVVATAVDVVRVGVLGLKIAFNTVALAVKAFNVVTLAALKPIMYVLDLLGNKNALANFEKEFSDATGAVAKAWADLSGNVEDAVNFEKASTIIRRIQEDANNAFVIENPANTERRTLPAILGKAARAAKPDVDGLTDAQKELKSASESVGDAFGSAFTSMIDGTKKAGAAFKDMARAIINDLFKIFVVKRITGFIASTIGTALGIPAVSTTPLASADGGGFTGAGSRTGGVDGKGGFPAILHPNETVIDHTKGQTIGGGGVTVIQNNNFESGVSRAEISAMIPRIVDTTKQAVFDAQRRSVSGRGYA